MDIKLLMFIGLLVLLLVEINMRFTKETVPCTHCGTPTNMLGTKLYDRCWELETRIDMNLELAEKIMEYVKKERVKRNVATSIQSK